MIELAPIDLWLEQATQNEALMHIFFQKGYRFPTWDELPQMRQLLNKEVILVWTEKTVRDPLFEMFDLNNNSSVPFKAKLIPVRDKDD
jgi:hypothetical protein